MAFKNAMEYAEVFQETLDEQIVQESKTSWMDENAGLVKYNGGKEVKIPKMSLTGLGNYDRNGGYPQGSVSLEFETRAMTQDRGTSFILDDMDVDETNFAVDATKVMTEFQRTEVVPEVDAYRISTLASYALKDNIRYGYTPSKADIKEQLAWACEVAGDDAVIMATPATIAALESAVGENNLEKEDFSVSGYDQRVVAFNGRPIIKVDPARMVTAIETMTLENGEGGGWKKAADAKQINFIAVARYAAVGVNKLERQKIFTPEENQSHDGWKLTYRRYHDMWVMDNKVKMIAVSIKDEKGPSFEIFPESLTVAPGGNTEYMINGDAEVSAYTVENIPQGVTSEFNDLGDRITLSINASKEAEAGTFTLTVSDGVSTATVDLTIS